ncbi:AAA-ATPase like domain containing protein, partial [Asbolus verrucosus]
MTKVFILVDEYDSIVSNALYNVKNADPQKKLEELESITTFSIKIICDVVKGHSEIIKGMFMTGILDVAAIAISSLLGNVMRRQFGTKNLCQNFYGFNEDEVCTLFNRWDVDEKLKKKAMAKYIGYTNGAMKPLYNPQSIVQFLYGINSRCAGDCSRSFSKLARLCDEDYSLAKFKEELANFQNSIICLFQQSTLIDPLNEATLQAIIIRVVCPRDGFLFGNEIIITNYETKIDVILYNDKFGGIVELKYDPRTSEDALKQIFIKYYYRAIQKSFYQVGHDIK